MKITNGKICPYCNSTDVHEVPWGYSEEWKCYHCQTHLINLYKVEPYGLNDFLLTIRFINHYVSDQNEALWSIQENYGLYQKRKDLELLHKLKSTYKDSEEVIDKLIAAIESEEIQPQEDLFPDPDEEEEDAT